MNALPSLQNLETSVEPLRQQPWMLADAFMDVPKHRPKHLAHIASRFNRIKGLHTEDNFQPIFLLKIPLPVCPGQTGHIDFTSINDNPTETADHSLYTTNLNGTPGHRIPDTHITVSSNLVRVPPWESIDGRIEIRVPTGTPQWSYGGLLQTEYSTGYKPWSGFLLIP